MNSAIASIICLAMAVASPAGEPPADLPAADEVRAVLQQLPSRLRSARISGQSESQLISPTAGKGPVTSGLRREVAFDGDRYYFRQLRDPESGEDQITVVGDGVLKLWLRNPIGPGFGKVRRPEPDELAANVHWAMPWVALDLLFFFDTEETAFQVTGRAEHHGMPTVAIAWTRGSRELRALLSTEHGFLPVLIEERQDGEPTRSVDVLRVTQAAPGVWLPAEIESRSAVGSDAIYADDALPPGYVRGEPLVSVTRRRLDAAEANVPISAELFDIKWAFGTEVIDEIAGITYFNGVDEYETVRSAITEMTAAAREEALDQTLAQAQEQRAAAGATSPAAMADAGTNHSPTRRAAATRSPALFAWHNAALALAALVLVGALIAVLARRSKQGKRPV